MGKHRKTRKTNQKGGAWYNPLSWGQASVVNGPRRTWGEWFSGTSNNMIQGADNAVGNAANYISTGAQNAYSNVFSSTPQQVAPVQSVPPTQPNSLDNQTSSTNTQSTVSTQDVSDYSNGSMGGKRRSRRTRRMKGGFSTVGGPENLSYYASPVHGLKVASPTYWVSSSTNAPLSGGSKRRRIKKQKSRRHKK